MNRCALVAAVLLAAVPAGGQDVDGDFESLGAVFASSVCPRDAFTELTGRDPANPWAWHFRGRAEQECGMLEAATTSYREACRLQPGLAWHWQHLGSVWIARGRPREALAGFEKADRLETRPDASRYLRARIEAIRRDTSRNADLADEVDAASRRRVTTGILAILAGALVWYAPLRASRRSGQDGEGHGVGQ